MAITRFPGRYEAGLYGPLVHVLFDHFPTMQNFLIKPQGVLYKPKPDAQRTHVPTQSYGGETGGIFGAPDFIICKATDDPSTDIIVTIMEVKRHEQKLADAIDQIQRYMVAAPEQDDLNRGAPDVGPVVGCLYGFLVLGERTRIFRYNVEHARQFLHYEQWAAQPNPQPPAPATPNAVPVPGEIHECDTVSEDLLQYLAKVSLKYWDHQAVAAWSGYGYRNHALRAALPHLDNILNYQ